MHRFHRRQIADPHRLGEGAEPADRAGIGRAGVAVADRGGEELQHPPLGLPPAPAHQRGHRSRNGSRNGNHRIAHASAHGLTIITPVGSKSGTLRVITCSPCRRAVAAISPSETLTTCPRPGRRRRSRPRAARSRHRWRGSGRRTGGRAVEPVPEIAPARSGREPGDAGGDLADGDRAQMHRILGEPGDPAPDRLGPLRMADLRQDAAVEQQLHRSGSRIAAAGRSRPSPSSEGPSISHVTRSGRWPARALVVRLRQHDHRVLAPGDALGSVAERAAHHLAQAVLGIGELPVHRHSRK